MAGSGLADPATVSFAKPPSEVRADVKRVRVALDRPADQGGVSAVAADNVVVATWNIREFGRVRDEWEGSGSPKRDKHALVLIAEIISRFDVVAVQEVQGDCSALRCLQVALGDDWRYVFTDTNLGSGAGGERLGYLWNRTRVRLDGLIGELTPGSGKVAELVHSPYAASFALVDDPAVRFTLLTTHIRFTDPKDDDSDGMPHLGDTTEEIVQLADWVKGLRRREPVGDLIVLGDFNIHAPDDEAAKAFVSTGLHIPDELADTQVIRTITSAVDHQPFYDQIAWFGRPRLRCRTAGSFNFQPVVYVEGARNSNADWLSYRMSDHVPLWVEFER